MDYKYIVLIILALAVVVAILFGYKKIKAKALGMSLDAENPNRVNKLKVKGDENIVKQGNGAKAAADNKANISGRKNDIEQK